MPTIKTVTVDIKSTAGQTEEELTTYYAKSVNIKLSDELPSKNDILPVEITIPGETTSSFTIPNNGDTTVDDPVSNSDGTYTYKVSWSGPEEASGTYTNCSVSIMASPDTVTKNNMSIDVDIVS